MSVCSGQIGINSQEYTSYKFLCSINKEEQQKITDFLDESMTLLSYAEPSFLMRYILYVAQC